MLVTECVRSVQYRCPQVKTGALPGRIDAEWLQPFTYHLAGRAPKPVEALKLIRFYQCQRSNHLGWAVSQAKRFCAALAEALIRRLPGYEEAKWGWSTEHEAMQRQPAAGADGKPTESTGGVQWRN